MAFNAIVLSKMNAFKLKYEWPDDGMMHLKKSRKDLPCSRRDMHGIELIIVLLIIYIYIYNIYIYIIIIIYIYIYDDIYIYILYTYI